VSETIRRSWLLVPLSREERITQAPRSGADVVVLDVVELVAEKDKPAARERAPAALEQVEALNRAFTPSAEEITAAQQILAGHMAHEVTALTQGDVIMNAGMTVQARRLLARSDACAAHEQRKMAAVQRLAAS
jgi:citrate lyase beta subunit